MAFLKLSDIGKIYTSENNVAVGIRKVNLSFEKGEFVAVTGKSGSGKTTLLNVIGGLDSYEEGELYVEGKSTSHYSKADWDEYVAKYVSFIFQDYNILESFTVLENIEFALTAIKDLKERKRRALEIAERVGLKDRLKTKGVKLSGGEKQRTVIARAIAKDSPIILADEPTGNLDSTNAKSILALLKEVSKDKLVIVVTHNYEDVKAYATRHIRIFDGKVESDEVFEKVSEAEYYKENDEKYEKERQYVFSKRKKNGRRDSTTVRADARDTFLLGWKRFTTRPRQNIFISAILFIALFGIIFSVAYFANVSFTGGNRQTINPIDGRVLVAGEGEGYSQADAEALKEKYGAKSYIVDDYVLDTAVSVEHSFEEISYNFAYIKPADTAKLDKGRLPSNASEAALRVPYVYANQYNIGDEIMINVGYSVKIVGLDFYIDNRNPMEIYLSEIGIANYAKWQRVQRNGIFYGVRKQTSEGVFEGFESYNSFKLYVDFSITDCTVKTNSEEFSKRLMGLYDGEGNLLCEEFYPVYDPKLSEKIDAYNLSLFLWVGPQMLEKLSSDRSLQISLLFADDESAIKAIDNMTNDGYITILSTKVRELNEKTVVEILIDFLSSTLISVLITAALALIVVVTLIKLISVSRNDVSIFRTMGIKDNTVRNSTYVQLFLALVPALILTGIVCLILYVAPTGWLLPFMGWDALLSMFICTAMILAIVAGSYNRLIYRQKIRKGLRRANK